MEGYVAIAPERYEQLIRAEHDANQLKALIDKTYTSFETLDRTKIVFLYDLYIGSKEAQA